ncbi:MAG: pyruvate kinase [Hoeflea sp.]|uniref:pyruvate kinase n=1 Tax=Hoeflea sp. TaxID=1940281 RepID=UPI001DC9FEA2|nr:pyruvate kinase [Hoeflea sp.]MBU4527296.1 pyruvate kinase [Alphaproteobacteria bacterium]MBU4546921.1 pyruvate kinase [Alphaproteobacteria bacterium]MBU4551567.1 pyruvate kinase [Alphaproteobacteria bacterium]MBV1725572.1 pyruvate kinase [Hoeflea sp.]MBV1759620.1 pyruvate kinase [Hoeflea sp.]
MSDTSTPVSDPISGQTHNAPNAGAIAACRDLLNDSIARIQTDCAKIFADWEPEIARPEFHTGAENLAFYLAARQYDLTGLQSSLSVLGLSSLGRAESHLRQSLAAVMATLDGLSGLPASWPDPSELDAGLAQITRDQELFFGDFPGEHNTRIMVTMPPQGATDAGFVDELIAAGASCFRINCAHDGPEAWASMIDHIRASSSKANRHCPVLMDIAGPKCRIESVDQPGTRLFRGDRFRLMTRPGRKHKRMPSITITFPDIVTRLQAGLQVWIDDGKIGARVVEIIDGGAVLEVTVAADKGKKLRLEKGINFPAIDLEIEHLTPADLAVLPFVATHADIVGCSFVQRPNDIRGLTAALRQYRGDMPPQPLLLKIETALAVRNLPRLIVQAGSHQPVAVMIARGDLAMEVGAERLSEAQEEILWLCEAAHIPVVWATQVLETLLKTGAPSRAEVTDAAMGQRAECIMLNKGPYIGETIRFLAGILRRMDRHQFKKTARLSALTSWRGPQPL